MGQQVVFSECILVALVCLDDISMYILTWCGSNINAKGYQVIIADMATDISHFISGSIPHANNGKWVYDGWSYKNGYNYTVTLDIHCYHNVSYIKHIPTWNCHQIKILKYFGWPLIKSSVSAFIRQIYCSFVWHYGIHLQVAGPCFGIKIISPGIMIINMMIDHLETVLSL